MRLIKRTNEVRKDLDYAIAFAPEYSNDLFEIKIVNGEFYDLDGDVLVTRFIVYYYEPATERF